MSLYSVLVGGLPSLPQEEIDQDDIEAAVDLADTKRVDWQLAFATKYFDACVPNPPGYSSSVAAITILPSAADLANAWGKWYAAAGQLRRLRFIRETIQEKIGYDINDDIDEDGAECESDGESGEDEFCDTQVPNTHIDNHDISDSGVKSSARRRKRIDREIFRECVENQDYYRSVLGVDHGSGLISYDFGPEQTAMYSREFAQGASNCCPNGCCEGRVRRATIDELRDMEKEALERVHAANLLLGKAQVRAIEVRQGLIGSGRKRNSTQKEGDEYNVGTYGEEAKVDESLETRQITTKVGNLEDQFDLFGSIPGYMRKQTLSLSRQGNLLMDQDTHHWALFERILVEQPHNSLRNSNHGSNWWGRLYRTFHEMQTKVIEDVQGEIQNFGAEVKDTVADRLIRESTYAVVTFMSRQAAVAARQCLADGRGQNRWITSMAVPVPPLADAAPFNLFFCRGCCRPVALSIHQRQKVCRNYV